MAPKIPKIPKPTPKRAQEPSDEGQSSKKRKDKEVVVDDEAVLQSEPPLIFKKDSDQAIRYKNLSKLPLSPTKYMCNSTLRTLGLNEGVHELLKTGGMLEFAMLERPTYKRLTLEFLSSCCLSRNPEFDELKSDDEWLFSFRIFNKDYRITLTKFGELLKLATDGIVEIPKDYNPAELWWRISMRDPDANGIERPLRKGEKLYDPARAKASRIYSPVLKYTLKVLANSIFARGESAGVFGNQDNYFLYCMMRLEDINPALFFARQLVKAGHKEHGEIVCGGFITALVENLAIPYTFLPVHELPKKLDIKNCMEAHWLDYREDAYWYIYYGRPMFAFPNEELTHFNKQENLKPRLEFFTRPFTRPASTSTDIPDDVPLSHLVNRDHLGPEFPTSSSRATRASKEDRNYELLLAIQKQNEEIKEENKKNYVGLKKKIKKGFMKIFSKLSITPPSSSDEEDHSRARDANAAGGST